MIAMACSCTKLEDVQNSIIITSCNLSAPNIVGGCDASIGIKNISSKTIKYIDFTINFYNAVGDRVRCEVRNRLSFWGKATGPLAPNEANTYKWDCPIYNKSARTIGISYVEITYMDDSVLVIDEKFIKYLYQ